MHANLVAIRKRRKRKPKSFFSEILNNWSNIILFSSVFAKKSIIGNALDKEDKNMNTYINPETISLKFSLSINFKIPCLTDYGFEE